MRQIRNFLSILPFIEGFSFHIHFFEEISIKIIIAFPSTLNRLAAAFFLSITFLLSHILTTHLVSVENAINFSWLETLFL